MRGRAWASGLVALLVAAGLGSCGGGDGGGPATDAGGRPMLPAGAASVAGGAAGDAATMSAEVATGEARSLIAPARPVEYRLADGAAAPATTGPAYRVTGEADEDRLLDVLGDGEGSVHVAGITWSYSRQDPDEPVGSSTSSSSEVAVACAPDTGCPEPVMPPPPPGVPSAADAEARFRAILDALGVDTAAGEFDTETGDAYARFVAFTPSIDGLAVDGLQSGISFGENGRVEHANGFLVAVEELGSYPLVDIDAAFRRFQEGFGGGIATLRGAAETGVAVDAPAGDGGGSSDGSTGSAGGAGEPALPVEDAAPPSTVPVAPEIVEVTGADLVLTVVFPPCGDGPAFLVPSFRLQPADRVHATVPAVEEASLATVPADPGAAGDPCPGEDVGDAPAGKPEPAPAPPEPDAQPAGRP